MGNTRYFTGKPCPHGHVCERMVSTWACVDCLYASVKRYAQEHPDKVATTGRKYRKQNAEKVKAWKSAEQKRNRASANKRQARYVEANREAVYARTEAWAKANPGKVCAKSRKRQTAELQRTPPWADQDAITGMYELAAVFRGAGVMLEVDHEIPLRGKRVSGLHVHDNLKLIHTTANRTKSNHFQGV